MMSFWAWTSQVILALLGIFLMIVILLQRGRGGGLAGAFGGTGGQSAFGTKAGDVFTRITIVIAILWVIVAGGSGFLLRAAAEQAGAQFGEGQPSGAGLIKDEPILEKPKASDVPAKPQPPVDATSAPAESTSAAPAATDAVNATPEGAESATTPAEPAAAPATTEPAKPAPADGATTPEQK